MLPEQICNADESGLYWKCLPSKTQAAEQERSAPGHKSSKERLTVLCCSNAADTHKLNLLVIGKANKPRSFKGRNKSGKFAGPLLRTEQRLVRDFLKSNNLTPKAVLTLDNAPSHPDASLLQSENKNITVRYLPPNVTA